MPPSDQTLLPDEGFLDEAVNQAIDQPMTW